MSLKLQLEVAIMIMELRHQKMKSNLPVPCKIFSDDRHHDIHHVSGRKTERQRDRETSWRAPDQPGGSRQLYGHGAARGVGGGHHNFGSFVLDGV